jgi:galactose-1-phosphate uridylyltransferase
MTCIICSTVSEGKEFTCPSKITEKEMKQLCREHNVKLRRVLRMYIKILNTPQNPNYLSGQIAEKKLLQTKIMMFLAEKGSKTTEQIYEEFARNYRSTINVALYKLVEKGYVLRQDVNGAIRYRMNPENSPVVIEVVG